MEHKRNLEDKTSNQVFYLPKVTKIYSVIVDSYSYGLAIAKTKKES